MNAIETWFHNIFVDIEKLLGLGPKSPAAAAAKADITAKVNAGPGTPEQKAQIHQTVAAIGNAHDAAGPVSTSPSGPSGVAATGATGISTPSK